MQNRKVANNNPEPKHVSILLLERKNMIMVEPCSSENFQGMVVKAPSFKAYEEVDAKEAFQRFSVKYNLTGIFSPVEKITNIMNFPLGEKIFHIFQIVQDRGNVQAKGHFSFINKREFKKGVVKLNGSGECIVTEALKKALLLT